MTDIGSALYDVLGHLQDGPVTAPAGLGKRAARRRRTRRSVTVAAAAVVAVAVALPFALVGPTRRATPAASTGVTAAQLAAGHWATLPDAPVATRVDPSTVWTGHQMLVWGGQLPDDAFASDGAAFDPVAGTWSVLPASPLSARLGSATVWTGTEMVIWGGIGAHGDLDDGAAYNPTTHTWRVLAPSTLSAREAVQSVMADGRMLVFGGRSSTSETPDLALYDPASDSWSKPVALPSTHAYGDPYNIVATDTDVLLEATWSTTTTVAPQTFSTNGGLDSFRFDPTTGDLTKLPDDQALDSNGTLIWTGKDVLEAAAARFFPGSHGPEQTGLRGARYDVSSGIRTVISHGPADDLRGSSIWTGAALFTYDTGTFTSGPTRDDQTHFPGEDAAWDPASDTWLPVPRAPGSHAQASVWTGSQLIEWGSLYLPRRGADKAPFQTLVFTPGS